MDVTKKVSSQPPKKKILKIQYVRHVLSHYFQMSSNGQPNGLDNHAKIGCVVVMGIQSLRVIFGTILSSVGNKKPNSPQMLHH